MRRGLAVLVVVLAVAPAASARPLLGVHAEPGRFDALTGQRSAGRNLFIGWGQGESWGSPFSDLLARMGPVPILSVNFGNASLTLLAVARGAGDPYLVALNHALAKWDRPEYVRPLPEMTGWWESYCAFTRSGRPKGAAYSTSAYRAEFRRIYRILHGTQPGLDLTPNPQVRVIW